MSYHCEMLRKYGTRAAAARALGVAVTTFKDRLDRELRRDGPGSPVSSDTHEMNMPALPEERPSIDVILDRITADYEQKKASSDAKEWFEIPVRDNLPFGLMFWGDPHIDNPGRDISLLRHHMRLAKHPAVFSVNIGDQMDGWVGRLTRLYADSQVSTHDARELSMWFLREVRWLLWLAGNHDCVTPDHEVLTRRGWVKFPDLINEDEVYGRNPDGSGVWQGINEIVSFPFSGNLVSIRSKGVSIDCTSNHRVLTVNRQGRKTRYVSADKISKYTIVPISAVSGDGIDMSDDEILLMAWLSTDCCIQPKRLTISQSKPKHIAEIKRILASLDLPFSASTRSRDITEVCGRVLVKKPMDEHTIALGSDVSKRLINKFGLRRDAHPDCVGDMTERQFDLYMNTVVDADGSWINNTATVYGSRGSLYDLQKHAVTKGWTATFAVDSRGDDRLYVRKKTEQIVVGPHERMPYTGDVWCLRVPTGNFMIRHNGKAHFTGNSWADNEVILRLMSEQSGVKLFPWQAKFRLTFPNGNDLKVHAAHDFPGRSMHNIVHGNMRAARMTSPADLLVDGHLHDWGHSQFEMAAFNRVITSVRVAGYKRIDSYANVNGYQSARHGSSCLVIVDPNMEGPARVVPMFDIDQGTFVLDGLISRYKAGARGAQAEVPALKKVDRRARKAPRKQPVRKQAKKAAGRRAA